MAAFSGDETAPFFGFLGAAAALVFSGMGAAYGTTKSGVGVASMGVMRPELVMKSIVPVVTAMLEFDNGQHMKLPYNRASLGPIGLSANSTWEGSFDFKLGHMKGPLKSAKGDNEGQVLSGTGLSNALSTLKHGSGRILPFRGNSAQIFNQGT